MPPPECHHSGDAEDHGVEDESIVGKRAGAPGRNREDERPGRSPSRVAIEGAGEDGGRRHSQQSRGAGLGARDRAQCHECGRGESGARAPARRRDRADGDRRDEEHRAFDPPRRDPLVEAGRAREGEDPPGQERRLGRRDPLGDLDRQRLRDGNSPIPRIRAA